MNCGSIRGPLLVMLSCVPLALACKTYIPGPGPNGTEQQPCGGWAFGCATYLSCPGDDTCPGGYLFGVDRCVCTVVGTPCPIYVDGTVDANGCCTNGTLTGLNGSGAIQICTPSGWCIIAEP